MSVRYSNIQADVIDIISDNPRQEDIFLVDTNVWYWQTYTKASILSKPWNQYQVQQYPSYLNKALAANSLLSYCGLSLMELVHSVERSEKKISIQQGNISTHLSLKEYRHNYPRARANIVSEIQLVCSQAG